MMRRPLTVVCVAALVIGMAGACNLPSGVKTDEQVKTVLFEDRPDRRDDDYDRAFGSELLIDPWKVQVTTAEHKPEIGGQTAGYIVVHVTVINDGVGKREPNRFHWQVLTPSGQLRNGITLGAAGDALPEEELQHDEQASGVVVFTTAGETGDFYVVFNPTKKDTDPRGVWGPIPVG